MSAILGSLVLFSSNNIWLSSMDSSKMTLIRCLKMNKKLSKLLMMKKRKQSKISF